MDVKSRPKVFSQHQFFVHPTADDCRSEPVEDATPGKVLYWLSNAFADIDVKAPPKAIRVFSIDIEIISNQGRKNFQLSFLVVDSIFPEKEGTLISFDKVNNIYIELLASAGGIVSNFYFIAFVVVNVAVDSLLEFP